MLAGLLGMLLSRGNIVLAVVFLLLGAVVGHVVQLGRRAERAYAEAVALQSAAAERERLSRSVHDGVLQALARLDLRAGRLVAVLPERPARAVAVRGLVARARTPRPHPTRPATRRSAGRRARPRQQVGEQA